MKNFIFLSLFLGLFLNSCEEKERIEGLWIVKKVSIGDQEKTPNARWTRFKPDHTQESGNGWFQHSYGTWDLDPVNNELTIVNTNGLNDPNAPFNITIHGDQMFWVRMEEGQEVKVSLERSEQLPSTIGDEVMGLWELESMEGNDGYFGDSEGSQAKGILFFRWDKRFVIGSEKGRINGVFNVHGHKPEVEMIPYGDQYKRNFWNMEIQENVLTLSLLNSDSTVTRTFKRIHEFPQ